MGDDAGVVLDEVGTLESQGLLESTNTLTAIVCPSFPDYVVDIIKTSNEYVEQILSYARGHAGKLDALEVALRTRVPDGSLAIIFAQSPKDVDDLARCLCEREWPVTSIH